MVHTAINGTDQTSSKKTAAADRFGIFDPLEVDGQASNKVAVVDVVYQTRSK